jgi:hypothetical protein
VLGVDGQLGAPRTTVRRLLSAPAEVLRAALRRR